PQGSLLSILCEILNHNHFLSKKCSLHYRFFALLESSAGPDEFFRVHQNAYSVFVSVFEFASPKS
ncbi:MAG: hypothetical protein P8J32_02345, partial [bacterium]|nr:hypothetical protein [bacterium]